MRTLAKWVIGVIIVLVAFLTYGRIMWTEVSDNFMKNPDMPYGAGDFRIWQDNKVESLVLAEPKLTFKKSTAEDLADWNKPAQFTEPWMNDVHEILNRMKIIYYSGTVKEGVKPSLEVQAQNAGWWSSVPNGGSTVYIGTSWHDYHQEIPERRGVYGKTIHKLYKSIDGGKSFKQLNWNPDWNISTAGVLFHPQSPNVGYIIGWGPAIYRTQDGGATWQDISVLSWAPWARKTLHEQQWIQADGTYKDASSFYQDARAKFDAKYLDKNNNLWLSLFSDAPESPRKGMSMIYMLPWGQTIPKLVATVPLKQVEDMVLDSQGNLFLLGKSKKRHEKPSALVRVTNGKAKVIKEFSEETDAGALYLLKSGTLIVDTVQGSGLGSDVLFISRNGGESWETQDEGFGAQGVYFNPETGERYRLKGYTLYKRTVN